jgi:hypothetical protein
MWYRIAKQGSVWSRISPEIESKFDELLDQSTIINDEIDFDQLSSIEKSWYRHKIDVKKLDKLFRGSSLKNLIIRFLEEEMSAAGRFNRSQFANIEKLAFIEKFIPTIFANKITLNAKSFKLLPYQKQRLILKHELGHAINSHTISYVESGNEPYVQARTFSKGDIGRDIEQTNLLILMNNIVNNAQELRNYMSDLLGENFEDYVKNSKIPLDEKLSRIKEVWQLFSDRVNTNLDVPDSVMEIVEKINGDSYNKRLGRVSRWDSKKISEDDLHKILKQRAQNLSFNYHDLYFANPEETRSHILEIQHLFSVPLFDQYFIYLIDRGIYENNASSKNRYLEDVNKMINSFMGLTSYKYYNIMDQNLYSSPFAFAEYFSLESVIDNWIKKEHDVKFTEQVAKHLSNVYQQLRDKFSVDAGSFKDLDKDLDKDFSDK